MSAVNTDNLTIREARHNSDPVIDGDLNPGDENGVEVHASGVTIRGLTVLNASGSFPNGNGFLVTGDNNTLTGNTASGNGTGFLLDFSDGNTLNHNKAQHNDGWGFLVDAVMANMFDKNHCKHNGLGGSNQPGIC